MKLNIIGQIVGFCAVVVSLLIYHQKTAKTMVRFKFVTDILWIIHFILIGAYTGMCTTTIGLLREICIMKRKKYAFLGKNIVLLMFCFSFFVAAALTWKNASSIFPAVASLVATLGFWSTGTKTIRGFSLISSLSMFIYGVLNLSLATITNEVITTTSIIVSFITEKLKKVNGAC